MNKRPAIILSFLSLLLGFNEATQAGREAICTKPDFIKKIKSSENKRLKPLGGKVSSVIPQGYSDGFCSYTFIHSDGYQTNMNVEIKSNGSFKIYGE